MITALLAALTIAASPHSAALNKFPNKVAGRYILQASSTYSQASSLHHLANDLQQVYGGTTIEVTPGDVPTILIAGWSEDDAELARSDPRLVTIDEDALLSLSDVQQFSSTTSNSALDRIDQRQNTPDKRFRYPFDGETVLIYIVDTGVSTTPGLSGRLATGASFIPNTTPYTDTNGHGTSMASIAASTSVGVAKRSTIVPVKVGTDALIQLSTLESALTWILTQPPGIVNISLSSQTSSTTQTTLEAKVSQLVAAGFPVIVAAGNDNIDASMTVPARVSTAITVGAMSTSTHSRWIDSSLSGSNYGPTLDLFAPGSAVPSETTTGSILITTGTSPATALTSGVAATLWNTGTLTPAQTESLIVNSSTTNALDTTILTSHNRLLFSDIRSKTDATTAISAGTVYCTYGIAPQYRPLTVSITAATIDKATNDTYVAYTAGPPALCTSSSYLTYGTITIEKRTPTGLVAWKQTLGSGLSFSNAATELRADSSGSLYVAGTTTDCGPNTCGGTAGFAAKLSLSTGAIAWVSRIETPQNDFAAGMVLRANALDVVGTTYGTVGATSYGGADIYIARLNTSTGALSTSPAPFQIGSSGDDSASDVAEQSGLIVIGGSTNGNLGGPSLGGSDGLLYAVLATSTSFISAGSAIHLGTALNDGITSIEGTIEQSTSGSADSLYVAGYTEGAFTSFTNAGARDVFLAKFENSLTSRSWLYQNGTSSDETSSRLALTDDDVFVASGTCALKASRSSGRTAWLSTEATSRFYVAPESSRYVKLFGGSTFDRRRAF